MFQSIKGCSSILLRQLKKSTLISTKNTTKLLQDVRQFAFPVRAITTTPLPEFDGHGFSSHDDLYRMSLEQPDKFWGTLARSRLTWYKDFGMVKDCDLSRGHIRWFLDGKINVSVNCVDRHAEKTPDKVALIWDKDEPGTEELVTYRELLSSMLCRMANVLKSHGIKRGDRVAIYLPTSPMAVAAIELLSMVCRIANVLKSHGIKRGDRVAIYLPTSPMAVAAIELLSMVCRIANVLKSHGIKRGDRVAIYLPTSPMAVAAMLACARIGAIHSVVFAGFSAEALAGRILDAQAETVITADQGLRGGKSIELKQVVDDAVKQCPGVKRVLVYQRTGADVPMSDIDFNLDEEMSKQPDVCEPEILDSEDYLFMLYTSGSTGKPKGIAHTQAGYILYANMTMKHVFDYNDGDIFACVADIGWITGHTYVVYGPLSNAATTVLFESNPVYPDPGRYWQMVERLKVNQLYLSPTALRLLLKSGDSWVTKYDRSTLKKLGCVGEPLNHEAWEWYYHVVGEGRSDICDTWWQTETGGICITPRPSGPGAEIRPAMPMRPFFGIDPVLMDPESGKEVTGGDVRGALCIRRPWPGMARTIYGDHQRFLDTYYNPYPGVYFSGDGAYRTKEGYYQITGRMDDVLNVSGHRLGTAEIEDVIDDLEETAESAVVGFPHDIKGEGIYAFVVLKDNVNKNEDEMRAELKSMVKSKLSSFAQPDVILFTPGLPKTRSGKIMRRILRKIAANKPDELGDVSTLFDPQIVDVLVEKHKQEVNNKS